jgi:transposase InsO family protein
MYHVYVIELKEGLRYTGYTENLEKRLSEHNNHLLSLWTMQFEELERTERICVSVITYLKTDQGNCYLSLITDAYSRKIVNYSISDPMTS